MTEQHPFADIDRKFREQKAKIRADEDLNYEAKERRVRALGLEYRGKREAAEKAISDRLDADEAASYRKAFGPGRSTLTAEQETARELRLSRIRAEVTDALQGGRDDAVRMYERAARAGDAERAEVIGKVGEKYLTEPARRMRLRQLVAENEPDATRRAKKRLAQLEGEKRTHELGAALNRVARSKEGSTR